MTMSWFLKAEVSWGWEVRSILRDLTVLGGRAVEVGRWIAVTVKPTVVRAVRMWEPRFPVACDGVRGWGPGWGMCGGRRLTPMRAILRKEVEAIVGREGML